MSPSRKVDADSAGSFVRRTSLGGGVVRVAVKDVVDIAGMVTGCGSAALKDGVPATKHADIIERILESDCVIVGKTKMHELAYGVTGLNEYSGTPLNVKFPDLIPGGSSSGSVVAVAADDCDWSVGTDTGGSIRVPAACCGVLGLKPTFGRISRGGLVPMETTLDSVGPFAKDAATLDLAMRILCPVWEKLPDISAARIGFLKVDAEELLRTSAFEAVALLGAAVKEIQFDYFVKSHEAGLAIIGAETYKAFGGLLNSGRVGADVAGRLKQAAKVTQRDLCESEEVRSNFTNEVDAFFENFDLLALPTLPVFPPLLSKSKDLMAQVNITKLCRPFNLSGHPAISIPLPALYGRPCALQLVAAKGRDETLVAAAAKIERAITSSLDVN